MREVKALKGPFWVGLGLLPWLPLPALAQGDPKAPSWKPIPKTDRTVSPSRPAWQPVPTPATDHRTPQWTPVPAEPGSSPREPIQWYPLSKQESSQLDADPPTEPDSSVSTRPPASQAEAEALLDRLPLSWADYPPVLRLGMLPTAKVLDPDDLQLAIGEVSPFNTGVAGGTGLQNYLGSIEMGLLENVQLSAYYTQADDPLPAIIPSRSIQPDNRWDAIAAGFRWRWAQRPHLTASLDATFERFSVKSGGTNSFGTAENSCNIFNSNCLSSVQTNNLISSFSLPLTWQPNRSLEFTLTPGVSFLPSSQGNANGYGPFYGTNIFVGAGLAYRPGARVQVFGSAMLPLGPGSNSFDADLVFSRRPVYAAGLRYSLNPRIALEGLLTNGYGLTPSTALLTLPSSDQVMYAGRLIYTPTRRDGPPFPSSQPGDHLRLSGLSVASANLLPAGESRIRFSAASNGVLSARYDLGFSNAFMFDLEIGQVSTGVDPVDAFAATYMTPGSTTIRGGGTALFFSQPRGDALSSALRMSFGRVLGETRYGYQFVEWINSYQINPSVSVQLNPKLAWSGTSTPAGFGLGLNWRLTPWLTLIPEGNLAAQGGQSNWTLSLRSCPSRRFCLDLYGTDALSFQDAGQLLQAAQPAVGMSMSWTF